ncbi:hypothetical protein [uncultured Nitratireductor sp.]|nr:hypothetical protein [uncultured Nitratireductor sp.]
MSYTDLFALLAIIALAFFTGIYYERLRSRLAWHDFPDDHQMDDDSTYT